MFRRLSRFTLQYVSLTTFGTPVLFVSCSLGCPRKTVRCLVTHKNQWIFMIFQCLRGRRARRREDNRRENGTNNKRTKSDYTTSKLMFFGLPGAHLNDIAQNGLPELPREPPGSCRGPFREAQEGPKRRQGRPKTAPRAAKSAPKAAQRQSKSGPGGHLGPTWPQRAPRRAPGGDFCPLGDRLWAPARLDLGCSQRFLGSAFHSDKVQGL